MCESNGIPTLVKGYRMKKAAFYVGDGDTGKSQLKRLVERLLGKGNFISIDLREIESRFGTGTLYGTRLAGSSDMSFMSIDELKTFKKLTGGDSLYAEFKGQQAFEFVYDGFLWFCMNRLPKFGGDDGKWIYDRIIVIKCPNVIPMEKQDKLLLEKMYAERIRRSRLCSASSQTDTDLPSRRAYPIIEQSTQERTVLLSAFLKNAWNTSAMSSLWTESQ